MKQKMMYIGTFAALFFLIQACEGQGQSYSGDTNYETTEVFDSVDEEMAMEDGEAELDVMEEPEVFNTEEYAYLPENDFLNPAVNPLSTFSIDVDNASYANARRMIHQGQKPPIGSIRTEEFVNYFDYNYPLPSKEETFSVYTEVGDCPWNESARLVHIGLKGYTLPIEQLPPSNLVFLIDVSGSMDSPNKLDLLKESYKRMVDRLNEKDRVSIVTYAGSNRVVLPSTSCEYKEVIKMAIDDLDAGGSTNGAGGINKAYEIAEQHFLENGNNRVILATDGDFNVGQSSDDELTRLIEKKRETGVFLTILGFGMGNYKDAKMESLADHGNGNYFYIDDHKESNRVLVSNLAGTLLTIAKDVKIQVEFNPALVKSYRLVGYENRVMNAEDFADDKKDAGELGAGHTVTAIYEIIPGKAPEFDLKYQEKSQKGSDELLWVKLRYKEPKGTKSKLIEMPLKDNGQHWSSNSDDFKFSAAVAGFSLILRESKYMNDFTIDDVAHLTKEVVTLDDMERIEFLQLVEEYKLIQEEI